MKNIFLSGKRKMKTIKTRSKRQRGGGRNINGELIDASSYGHPTIVKILLDEGADVNALDGQKRPALFWASFNGHAEVVKNLLKYGADVTIKDNRGHTALYWANFNGHKKVVELLNRPTERQQDKENLAMVMREKRVERKFGKHRLPPEIGRNIDECLGGKRRTKKSKRQTCSKRQRGSGATCSRPAGVMTDNSVEIGMRLLDASSSGNTILVQTILSCREDVNVETRGGNGRTALWTASWDGHTKIVSMLLEKGADANTTDSSGRTALWTASANGHTEIVSMLLGKGALVETNDGSVRDGRTALWMASANGYTDIVNMLLKKGANRKTDDGTGRTALRMAMPDHPDIVSSLAGEEIKNAKNKGSLSVIQAATRKGKVDDGASHAQRKFFNFDENTGPTLGPYLDTNPNDEWFDPNTLLTKNKNGGKKTKKRKTRKSKRKNNKSKKSNKRFRKTRSKRQRGGNPDEQDEKDQYLFNAISIYDYEKVEEALNNGANVNALNNDGDTPLIHAIKVSDIEIVYLLLYHEDIIIKLDLATNKELQLAEDLWDDMTPEDQEENGIPYAIEDYIVTKNQIKEHKYKNIKQLSNYKRPNIPSLKTMAYYQSPSSLDTYINLNPGTIDRPHGKLGGKRRTRKSKRSKKRKVDRRTRKRT